MTVATATPPLTPEESAFARAIRARPESESARLVFADWLDEHDQPDRAELLRAQVDLARRRVVTRTHRELWPECRCQWHTLRSRVVALSDRPGVREWVAALRLPDPPGLARHMRTLFGW